MAQARAAGAVAARLQRAEQLQRTVGGHHARIVGGQQAAQNPRAPADQGGAVGAPRLQIATTQRDFADRDLPVIMRQLRAQVGQRLFDEPDGIGMACFECGDLRQAEPSAGGSSRRF
jgi:hypothetical protein